MEEGAFLTQLFNKNAIVPLKPHYEKHKVTLVEEHKNTKSSSQIHIHNVPADALVIKVDDSFDNTQLFSGNKGECKRCDYLIITPSHKAALFIELKKSNPSKNHEVVKQLKGGLCVFEYCQIIAREFFSNEILTSFKKQFIVVTHIKVNKRRTSNSKEKKPHPEPADPMRIAGNQPLEFKRIAP